MSQERKNEESVDEGTLTTYQADKLNEEWETVSYPTHRHNYFLQLGNSCDIQRVIKDRC